MKEVLVSIDIAHLAKEKGFNVICESKYSTMAPPNYIIPMDTQIPSQSLLQKWLREKHNIHIIIIREKINDKKNFWNLMICPDGNLERIYNRNNYYEGYNTYEDALEDGLRKILLSIKE